MRIAIISFQDNTDIIGAKYIHAFLLSHKYESHLILQPNSDVKADIAIFKFIEEHNIEIIGISLMSNEHFRVNHFAKELKRRFNTIPLIFGGIHATIAPEECLSAGDIAVIGEGEHTFLELVRCIEQNKGYRKIPGICYKNNGHVNLNPCRALEKDIDMFPFPQHLPQNMYVAHKGRVNRMNEELFNLYSRYNGTFPNLITTRGCPYSCTYCCNSVYKSLYGNLQIRKRSVESVISECLDIITQRKDYLSLNIQDDCFLAYDENWINDFSEQYRYKVRLPFIIRTTPRHITKEKLVTLKKAGLAMVMIGLQSGSDRINKEIFKRNVTSKHFLNAAKMVKEADLCGYYDIILDNPYDTEEYILETLKVALKIPKPFQFQLFSLCLYQGTELFKKATKEGLLFADPRINDNEQIAPTTLNKLICMVPTVPAPLIEYFSRHRNNVLIIIIINLFNFFNTAILKPFSFLKLMHRAYGSNLRTTIKLIRLFSKTAIGKMLKKME